MGGGYTYADTTWEVTGTTDQVTTTFQGLPVSSLGPPVGYNMLPWQPPKPYGMGNYPPAASAIPLNPQVSDDPLFDRIIEHWSVPLVTLALIVAFVLSVT